VSAPRRSLGPVIAYMLTLLGLVLGGIWMWNALQRTPVLRTSPEVQATPLPATEPAAPAAPPQTAGPAPRGEAFSATERQQLENILRQKSGGKAR
jgi:hypothetical protein